MIEVNLATLFVIALIAGVGAYFGSYLREKGKNLATKEDIDRIVRRTEEIKADITGGLWVEQSRWTFKAGIYKEILESAAMLASSLTQLSEVERQRTSAAQNPERIQMLERIEKDYERQGVKAFSRLIKCGAVARAWLSSEALHALDTFADKWGQAWTAPTTTEGRTREMKTAATQLNALLCRVVQDDLQLRRMS